MGQLPQDENGWRKLLRAVRRATRYRDDAEDLLHSAFLKLAEYRKKNEVQNPKAFLVRTAVNLAVDDARHQRVRNETATEVLIEISADEPLQSEALAARERLRRVEEGLGQLSPRTREIFLMHRIDGLKYREIAARLGITVSFHHRQMARFGYLTNELKHLVPGT